MGDAALAFAFVVVAAVLVADLVVVYGLGVADGPGLRRPPRFLVPPCLAEVSARRAAGLSAFEDVAPDE